MSLEQEPLDNNSEESTAKSKGGRPKGSKNKPKPGRPRTKPRRRVKRGKGRPKGVLNKKKRGRKKGWNMVVGDIKIPKVRPPREKKPEFVTLPTIEAKVVRKEDAPLPSKENEMIDSQISDEKFLEAGYNTHTEKIINAQPIDSSYYYRGSKNVPVAGAQYEFTADMIDELRKCKEDILYFAENFFYIVNLDRGKEKIQLYEAQRNMLMSMISTRFSVNLAARQSGKCLQSNTLLKIRDKNTKEIKDITIESLFVNSQTTIFNKDCFDKIIKTKGITDFEIFTDTGWKDLEAVYKTVPYQVWKIKTQDYYLECADDHIVFKENFQQSYIKDLILNDLIMTEKGFQQITSIEISEKLENMYDVAVKDENHRFYSNGILSHNSTLLTIFALWMVCFNDDYRIAIVANKEITAINIFKRIRVAYEQLPNYIKPGVKDYAKTGMTLGNDSSVIVSTTTATSIRGDSLNCIAGDSKVLYKSKEGQLYEFTLKELHESIVRGDSRI